jgi:CheY-like chemotaxis protein
MEEAVPTILLLDDDRDFLEQNASVLAARGYRVVCFSDAERALAGMEADRPDLVITDLMMKELDSGFSFARRIRGDPRYAKIPVIIVTAVASQIGFDFTPRASGDLAAMAADAYFDKPVAPRALIAKVEELLAGGRSGEPR